MSCLFLRRVSEGERGGVELQFIFVTTSFNFAVVSALDELKRTSGRARDAIRWLESQFRQGNRFLRMQRNNEKQAIPAVSYPRKKDNEAWYV